MRVEDTPKALAAVTKSMALTFIVSARSNRAKPAQLVSPMITAKRKSRTSALSSPVAYISGCLSMKT